MALRVRGAPQLATLSRACHILRPHRQVTTATGSIDVATETDLKSSSALPASEGSVSFAPLKVAWKPRVSTQKVAVEGSRLFASSNDPLKHTLDDVGKFFQLDGSTPAFEKVFYHTGFCGDLVTERQQKLKTSAMMVRKSGVQLRDELLQLEEQGRLGNSPGSVPGMVLQGDRGVGKSMVLNYVIACMETAGWLVAVMPHAADWTLGLGAKSLQFANEAYRVTDPNHFSDLPPELQESNLYEQPEATAHFLVSFYLSQREKLATIPVKGEERREHYATCAMDPSKGPTLADMLAPYVRDDRNGFAEFPIPVRPMHDLLAELQLVTEYPTLLVIDGWNRWHYMATSCHWRSKVPLHAQQILAPSLLGENLSYGAGMARGAMLCSLTYGGARQAKIPRALRRHIPPPHDFVRPNTLPEDVRTALRTVMPYKHSEVQAALEFYALTGHCQNPALDAQLRTGELGSKISMLSAGVADDVYKLCEQM